MKAGEAGVQLGVEAIRATAQIIGSGLRMIGQIGRGIAENPDPVSQGVAIVSAAAALAWFSTTPLGERIEKILPLGNFPGSANLPVRDRTGLFGVKRSPKPVNQDEILWYMTRGQRDSYFDAIASSNLLGIQNYSKVKRFLYQKGPFKTPEEAQAEADLENAPGTPEHYAKVWKDGSVYWSVQTPNANPQDSYDDDGTGDSG